MVHFQLPNSFTILLFPSFFCVIQLNQIYEAGVLLVIMMMIILNLDSVKLTLCFKTGQRTGRGICQYIGREQHFKPAFPHSSKPRAPIGQGTTHCFK